MTKAEPTLRSLRDLMDAGLLSPEGAGALEEVVERYALAVTPAMAGLIDRSDAEDPIARQFVPRAEELVETEGERADPIGDEAMSPLAGVVHRYPDRVLLKLVHACPVYCRFCFRRTMVGPGGEGPLDGEKLDAALSYVAARPEIFEVILTGGDPFMLSPRRIAMVTARLAAIPHVAVLRWHTRVPIVDPARVDADLALALRAGAKAVYVAVHANHPREIGAEAKAALARLADAGIALLSQSVLLRGVNDDPSVLEALMRALLAARVRPYYLHHPDLAPGTAHFRLPLAEGRAIVKALDGRLSGLARPTYVVDIPGGAGKAVASPGGVELAPDGTARLHDFRGRVHVYPPPGEET